MGRLRGARYRGPRIGATGEDTLTGYSRRRSDDDELGPTWVDELIVAHPEIEREVQDWWGAYSGPAHRTSV